MASGIPLVELPALKGVVRQPAMSAARRTLTPRCTSVLKAFENLLAAINPESQEGTSISVSTVGLVKLYLPAEDPQPLTSYL